MGILIQAVRSDLLIQFSVPGTWYWQNTVCWTSHAELDALHVADRHLYSAIGIGDTELCILSLARRLWRTHVCVQIWIHGRWLWTCHRLTFSHYSWRTIRYEQLWHRPHARRLHSESCSSTLSAFMVAYTKTFARCLCLCEHRFSVRGHRLVDEVHRRRRSFNCTRIVFQAPWIGCWSQLACTFSSCFGPCLRRKSVNTCVVRYFRSKFRVDYSYLQLQEGYYCIAPLEPNCLMTHTYLISVLSASLFHGLVRGDWGIHDILLNLDEKQLGHRVVSMKRTGIWNT